MALLTLRPLGSASILALLASVVVIVGDLATRYAKVTSYKKDTFSILIENTAKLQVTKIEMRTVDPFRSHWLALLHLSDGGKVVAHLSNQATGGERYADGALSKWDRYTTIDAHVDAPKEKDKDNLLLSRVIECVSDEGITAVDGMCFIYAYRIMMFATGQCGCGECLKAGSTALADMQKRVKDAKVDKAIIVTEEFKTTLKNWGKTDDASSTASTAKKNCKQLVDCCICS